MFVPPRTNWCSTIPEGRTSSNWKGRENRSVPFSAVTLMPSRLHTPSSETLSPSSSFGPPAASVSGLPTTRNAKPLVSLRVLVAGKSSPAPNLPMTHWFMFKSVRRRNQPVMSMPEGRQTSMNWLVTSL